MLNNFKAIAVFCGSNAGHQKIYHQSAEIMANSLVENNITLVYGGAKVGLMGVIADRVLDLGGEVIGVMPQMLIDKEIAHPKLTKLHIVNSMHERKALCAELSQGFIMLPGGAGSLDEFFEIFTWTQLGLHSKPCGILNVNNYYKQLLNFLDLTVDEGFMKKEQRDMILVDEKPEGLLAQFYLYKVSTVSKWINKTV